MSTSVLTVLNAVRPSSNSSDNQRRKPGPKTVTESDSQPFSIERLRQLDDFRKFVEELKNRDVKPKIAERYEPNYITSSEEQQRTMGNSQMMLSKSDKGTIKFNTADTTVTDVTLKSLVTSSERNKFNNRIKRTLFVLYVLFPMAVPCVHPIALSIVNLLAKITVALSDKMPMGKYQIRLVNTVVLMFFMNAYGLDKMLHSYLSKLVSERVNKASGSLSNALSNFGKPSESEIEMTKMDPDTLNDLIAEKRNFLENARSIRSTVT